MSKKLYFLISLVLVLALAVSTSADTLLASYEKSEALAHNLTVTVNNPGANISEAIIWPMLQDSYDPNFGPGLKVPAATDGNCVMGVYWTNEEDGRIDIEHKWTTTFDLTNVDKILLDVYIPGPNGVPSTIELWDDNLAWLLGHHDPIVTGKWFTVTFDLSELQETGKRLTNHSHITTIYFSGVPTKDGKAFFDNLRLQRAAAPKPSTPKPKPVKGPNDVNVGAKKP
ncbi:MAG: hypothetical protein ABSG99_00645 [Sedimentisphaerales bacterium]